MKLRRAVSLFAALASAFFTTAVHAAATGSTSISNFRVELADLAPNDGIAPSLRYLEGQGWQAFTSSWVQNASRSIDVYENKLLPSGWQAQIVDVAATVSSGAEEMEVLIWADSTAILNNVITPVPEPQTYAMMLAGLALVGFAVGRRRASPRS